MLAATLILAALTAFIAIRDDRAFEGSGPQLIVRKRSGETVFEWRHPILPPMAAQFASAFDEHRDRADRIVIDLHSPGGMVAEGGAVIEEIERMKATHAVETRVRSGAVCASMCVPVYLAGERRTAAPSARFMFHEPTAHDFFSDEEIDQPEFERRMDVERFFRRYIDPTEIDPAFAEELRESVREGDVWFSARELVRLRTNIVEDLKY